MIVWRISINYINVRNQYKFYNIKKCINAYEKSIKTANVNNTV